MAILKHHFYTVPILIVAMLTCLPLRAQERHRRISVEEQLQILKNKLQLNDRQIKKVTTILEDQREEITMAMSTYRSDSTAKQGAIQGIIIMSDAQIKKILTEKQTIAYEEIIQARQK
jgi:hypothetical protein